MHTRKHGRRSRRGGMDSIVPRKIALRTIYRTAAQIASNKAHFRKLDEETKKKFRPVARHAAAVAREKSGHAAPYYTKKHKGGRHTRRR